MSSGFGESTSKQPQSPSCSSNNDAANFECNICLDLAQDPIVTLCGHLFCWPCLYKWLHIHSRSKECPVCKALVEEEKLVPLYGRGKNSTDPRSKSIPGLEIPHRPNAQRPETSVPPEHNHFGQNGFGFMGGVSPFGAPRFGDFTFSAAFGGLFPSLFNIQWHGYGAGVGAGYPFGYPNTFHGGHPHGFPLRGTPQNQSDHNLKLLFLVIGMSVILALICS